MGRGEAAAVAAAPSLASASSDAPLLQYELATILSPERGFVDRGILAETQEHRRRVKGSSIVEAEAQTPRHYCPEDQLILPSVRTPRAFCALPMPDPGALVVDSDAPKCRDSVDPSSNRSIGGYRHYRDSYRHLGADLSMFPLLAFRRAEPIQSGVFRAKR